MKKNITILIIFILLISTAVFYWRDKGDFDLSTSEQLETEWGDPETVIKEAEKSSVDLPKVGLEYTDPFLGISFRYPKDFGVSSFKESEGEYVVLVQDVNKKVGVQISSLSFSDPFTSLTKERIESDLGITLSKYSIIKIGKDSGIDAVTFVSGTSVLYREVWFVNNDLLIQVKAYQSSEPLIIAILQTLKI